MLHFYLVEVIGKVYFLQPPWN